MTKKIDRHTLNANNVAEHEYFVVNLESSNENVGLLIGTEVKKCSAPTGRQSRQYGYGTYWSVVVTCPNGETRKLCCDALTPRKDGKYFKNMQSIYRQVA